MKNLVIILAASLFLSSCAVHGGYITNSASLSSNNFIYIETAAKGTAEATYIFGAGGLDRDALVEDARQNLLRNFPLNDNQTLVNITLSFKKTYVLPFFIKNKCTVSASIVQFTFSGQKTIVDQINNSLEKRNEMRAEEARIDSARSRHLSPSKYDNLSDVKPGDIVTFNTAYNEVIYGIVHQVKTHFVELKTFPSPGNMLYQDIHWKELRKVDK
jgi:hypothetical protein